MEGPGLVTRVSLVKLLSHLARSRVVHSPGLTLRPVGPICLAVATAFGVMLYAAVAGRRLNVK